MFQANLISIGILMSCLGFLQKAIAFELESNGPYELRVDAFYQKIGVKEVSQCEPAPTWVEPNLDQNFCMYRGSDIELNLKHSDSSSGTPAYLIVEQVVERRSSVVFINPFLLFRESNDGELRALPFSDRSCALVCQDLGFNRCSYQESKGFEVFNGVRRACVESVGEHRVRSFPLGQKVCRPLVTFICKGRYS